MMLHVANSRIDEIEDGANIAARGVAIVRPLPVSTTTANTIDVLDRRLAGPLDYPRRTVDRFVIPHRTVAAPAIALPQRVLSP